VIGCPGEIIPGGEGLGGFCGGSAVEVPPELTGRVGILGRDCCCSRGVPGIIVVDTAIVGVVTSEEIV